MNMKKLIKILVVIMIVSFGIGNAIFSFTGGFTEKNKEVYNIDEEKIESIEGINNILISGTSERINIIPEDREDIKMHFYGRVSGINKPPKLDIRKSGGIIEIESEHDNHIFGIYRSNLILDVHIPRNYKDNIKVKMSSGELEIKEELTLSDFWAQCSSGEIYLKNLTSENLEIDITSGEVLGDTINTNNTRIKSTSGDVELINFTGNIKAENTSGNISINYYKFHNNIDLNSTSGNVKLDLPEDAQFYLDAKATSGDIECDFPITMKGKFEKDNLEGTVGSDKNKINIKITSGNLNIK